MSDWRLLIPLGLLAAPALGAPQATADKPMRLLSGTLAFAEPAALPADARVRVELVDLRGSRTLAAAEWPLARRHAPLPFAVPYFLGDAAPGPHYRLRASVSHGGKPVYLSLAPMPVLRTLRDRHAELILERAGPAIEAVTAPPPPVQAAPPARPLPEAAKPEAVPPVAVQPAVEPAPPAPGAVREVAGLPLAVPVEPPAAAVKLEDSYWRLVEIDGQPVRAVPGGREPHLVLFAGRANANSGCNKLLAPYTLPAAGVIQLGTLASTRMACPEGYADQEAAYLKALAASTRYRVDGARLSLGDGTVTRLRFEFREIR